MIYASYAFVEKEWHILFDKEMLEKNIGII